MIDQDHHLRNTHIEAQVLNSLGDFKNGFMQKTKGSLIGFLAILVFTLSEAFPVNLSKKTMDPFDPFFTPRLDCLQRAEEHFEEAEWESAPYASMTTSGLTTLPTLLDILFPSSPRINPGERASCRVRDVQARLRHKGIDARTGHKASGAPHVPLHRCKSPVLPVGFLFRINQAFQVFRIQVAEVIPTGTGPLGHSVGLAGGGHQFSPSGLGSVREIDFPDCRSNQISNQSVIVAMGLSPVPAGW